MNRLLVLLLLAFISVQTYAQGLGAYTDYRGHFFIFDKGKHHRAEDLAVQSFKIGGEQVLYVNSQGRLKMYENGRISELERAGVSKYFATDYLSAYSVFQELLVVENGEAVTLSNRCPLYKVEDSLIVFYDKNRESLRIYYNQEIEDIENGLIGLPVNHLKSGDNIVAYISSPNNNFKIYYKGQNQTVIQYVEQVRFEAGKDIVAYVNPLDNSFNVFFRGEFYRLEDFPPQTFKTGDGFVAYVDDMGYFKVFSEQGIQEVSNAKPQAYLCEDQLMVFSEYDYFKVFTRGKVTELEPYLPGNFKMDWSTLLYLDNTNRIWMFSEGENEYLVNEMIKDFDIYRDVVILNLQMDKNRIYWQGEFYEGMAY